MVPKLGAKGLFQLAEYRNDEKKSPKQSLSTSIIIGKKVARDKKNKMKINFSARK